MKTLAAMVLLTVGLVAAGFYGVFEDDTTILLTVVCAWNPVMIGLGWALHHAGVYLQLGWSTGRGSRRRLGSKKRVEQLLQEEI